MKKKKKVLLVWWYDRNDLIAPYLSMQDEIEFTVLFYRFPEQENKAVADKLPFRKIYWLDYLSPYALLKDVRPDKILFFGNESTTTIALIAAANVKDIPTCYVSHGLRSDLKEIIENGNTEQSIERYRPDNKYYTAKKWHTLVFLMLAFSWRSWKSLKLIWDTLRAEMKFSNSFDKLLYIKNSLRKTKYYYLFAPENARMIEDLDHPNPANIFYTGPYMMDAIFKDLSTNIPAHQPYWLLIDQPLNLISFEERKALYLKIASNAAHSNQPLIVKLHPMEYGRDVQDGDNIIWKKNVSNLNELIAQSGQVIGFYSALMLPVLCYKKCILFDTNSTALVKKWKAIGIAKVLNFNDFDTRDIDFDNFEILEASRQNFIRQFVSYTDGHCTERLKQLILSSQ